MVEISVLKRPASEAVITQRKFFKKTARGKVIKGALNLLNLLYQNFWSFFAQFFVNDIFGMMYHVVFKAARSVKQRFQVHFLCLGSWDILRFRTVISFCQIQMFSCPKLVGKIMLFLILTNYHIDGPCRITIIHTSLNFTANRHRRSTPSIASFV